jgi:protein-tyrosine phosphatase
MPSIVFICTGNICRSAMAEYMLREKLRLISRADIRISSMGIHGLDNQPASELSREICLENTIDISAHRSRPLAGQELIDADLILTMDSLHLDFVKLFFPQVGEKVFMLGAWPNEGTKKDSVPDPIGRPRKAYIQVYQLINRHLDRILPEILDFFPKKD